jgi:hypothetical protein
MKALNVGGNWPLCPLWIVPYFYLKSEEHIFVVLLIITFPSDLSSHITTPVLSPVFW